MWGSARAVRLLVSAGVAPPPPPPPPPFDPLLEYCSDDQAAAPPPPCEAHVLRLTSDVKASAARVAVQVAESARLEALLAGMPVSRGRACARARNRPIRSPLFALQQTTQRAAASSGTPATGIKRRESVCAPSRAMRNAAP